jgi:HAD superfamily hydrolase (TIGR01493 family)
VLLDVYGTLVRDDEAWVAAAAAAVADLAGVEPEAVAAHWVTRLYAMADTAHGDGFVTLADLNTGSLTETANHFGVRVDARQLCTPPPRPPLFADSLPFLAAVKLPVCLDSVADRDSLHAVLDHHGVRPAAVVTSQQARAYKPRPEPFELALRHLGLRPGDVIHVGDSPASDIAGAAALGIDTAYLDRAGRPLPPGLSATHTINTLTALLPLLPA